MKRANGEGSIYQRKDGRWVGSAILLSPGGQRLRRSVYGRTRKEVHQQLTALLRADQLGLPTPDQRTVAVYLEHWLTHVAKHKVRASTYRSYETYVRVHLIPGLGQRRLDRLSAADIRAFLNAKRATHLAPRTIQYLHAILRAALSQAVRDDLVPRNVAKLVETPRAPRAEVQPLSVEESKQLLAAAARDRLHAFYAVALAMGLRRGEALGLRWDDIDFEVGVLHVRRALQYVDRKLAFVDPKTSRSRRSIPMPDVCVRALTAHRTRQAEERLAAGSKWQDHNLVFATVIGTPLDPRNVSRRFGNLCRIAGIRHIRLHDLRHTCATLLLAQGVAPRVVMETLGHSGISLTMNTYTHVLPVLQRDAASKIDHVLGA